MERLFELGALCALVILSTETILKLSLKNFPLCTCNLNPCVSSRNIFKDKTTRCAASA